MKRTNGLMTLFSARSTVPYVRRFVSYAGRVSELRHANVGQAIGFFIFLL